MQDAAWKGYVDVLLGVVKDRAGKFLDENKDARDFLQDRAERLGKLAWAYTVATDDDVKAQLMKNIGVVRQSIDNELSTVALKAAAAARATFMAVLTAVFDTLIRSLPAVLAAR